MSIHGLSFTLSLVVRGVYTWRCPTWNSLSVVLLTGIWPLLPFPRSGPVRDPTITRPLLPITAQSAALPTNQGTEPGPGDGGFHLVVAWAGLKLSYGRL